MGQSSVDEAMAELFAWATQTVGLAICLRSCAEGRPIENGRTLDRYRAEAIQIASKHRALAIAECGENCPIPQYRLAFAGKVLSWCSEHRFSGD